MESEGHIAVRVTRELLDAAVDCAVDVTKKVVAQEQANGARFEDFGDWPRLIDALLLGLEHVVRARGQHQEHVDESAGNDAVLVAAVSFVAVCSRAGRPIDDIASVYERAQRVDRLQLRRAKRKRGMLVPPFFTEGLYVHAGQLWFATDDFGSVGI